MATIDEQRVREVVRQVIERHLAVARADEPRALESAATPGADAARRVAIGSDHGGFELKRVLIAYIGDELGWTVHDCGTHSTDAVDYPDFAAAVAREVAAGRSRRGIVIDAAGIGSTMAANKIAGVRCALCHDDATALNARQHNDANLMALGARVVNRGLAQRLVRLFLATEFEGGRHQRRVLKIMAPATFGVSVAQISLLLNTIFASYLPGGSVSWLYYADRLMELPAGMLGVALGTILLPSLSKYHADANREEYARLLDWGLRMTVLLAVPAAAALAVIAMPLVASLFHYGRFGAEDAWMTCRALIAYSIGLIGMILVKILAPGFYARQNVRTPVKIGIVTLILTQLMNLAFIGPLQHAGLALAIGLGACLNAALLYRVLRRTGVYEPQPGWPLFLLKVAAAVGFMAIVLFTTMGESIWWLAAPWQRKVPAVLGLVLLGTLAYGGCLALFGFRPRDFSRRGAA